MMIRAKTRNVHLEIDAKLYAKFSKVAEQKGHSRRFLLEKALEHYLEVVVPSQMKVRSEVVGHFRQSTEKNRRLLRLLAQH